jgi:EmrB/QacA subfamily drug resistance transporter
MRYIDTDDMKLDGWDETGRAALIVAGLSSFLGPFMASSVNVALPSMGAEFAMGAVLLGWVNTAFLLAAAAPLVPFGRLGDMYGRKRLFVSGTAILIAASSVIASASSAGMVIAGRVLQGFGASMIFATGMAILVSAVPARQRGEALGISVAAVYLGLSTGPFFGGLVTQHLGWRWIFWLNLLPGLILLAVAVWMLKGEWADARRTRFDWKGSLVLALGLVATMYGFASLPSRPAPYFIAAGVLGLALFVFIEQRTANPVLDIDLFRRNTVFAFSSLAALINYAATFAVGFLLSLYLQQVKGLTPHAAGLVLVAQPVVMTVFSPFTGRLSDRIEPRTLASLGMAAAFVGLGLLTLLSVDSPIGYVVGCLVFLGLGFALFSSPNTNAIMSSVRREFYGVAGAVVSAMRQIGMMFSMGIVMMILALLLGSSEISSRNQDQFVTSMRVAFTVFAVLCFAGIFASLARGRMNRNA